MTENNDADETENQNIRQAVDDEWELPEPPYFYSPYPDNLVQVHRPGTRGGREVCEIVNKHWPASIDELVELSKEETGDGYSGSFIRTTLRNHYAPEDLLGSGESENNDGETEESSEVELNSIEENRIEQHSTPESMTDEAWHKIFRMGIRAALENNIEKENAFAAFESGFIEGGKLKEEME